MSHRERELIRLVAQGLRNRAIADRMAITQGTVKAHLHNTYVKLGLTNRIERMVYAREHGLL